MGRPLETARSGTVWKSQTMTVSIFFGHPGCGLKGSGSGTFIFFPELSWEAEGLKDRQEEDGFFREHGQRAGLGPGGGPGWRAALRDAG